MPNRRVVAWTAAGLVALGGVGWVVGAAGWPGEPSGCIAAGDCSCEAFAAGIVVQPINTLSSLLLVLAGIGILWFVPARAPDRRRRIAYAAAVIGLGVGSATFHASMTEWGGWLDLVGIHLFLGVIVAIDLAVLGDRPDRWLLRTVIGGGVAAAVVLWFVDNSLGRYTAGALVAIIAVAEWRIRQHELRSNRRWLWSAVGLFGVGLGLQWLGRGGGPWCDPDVVLQPHALWHLFAAVAAIALSRYLLTRRDSRNA